MYRYSVPPMLRNLRALSAILAKAEAHCTARKIEPEALLGFRLFPDMLPLTRQVQLACDFAARASARLAGAEMPSFPDTETSFAQLIARIRTATDYIESFDAGQFEGAESRSITMKQRGGEVTMTGLDYLTGFALPNFYFHTATAYDILRHNGLEIGKMDYVGS
ncbi:MAG: DUF1993 domain-containing protein [Cereibacter changlensis]|uniref:DUF1993 domain-containing protein n=2 Tax=Cereibacter changlensis TaxID=402884 RepID=A0A2T4JXW3_9RHOB|nr:DUF1993 domain-containing protein [Cereibacter changlensis]PTE22762.1 DUF1993 domain-containing protein [Cereibacter changlensis JA139]PZX52361.1 hypothetical protein LX76_02890 [Cereibacter changlensis]